MTANCKKNINKIVEKSLAVGKKRGRSIEKKTPIKKSSTKKQKVKKTEKEGW